MKRLLLLNALFLWTLCVLAQSVPVTYTITADNTATITGLSQAGSTLSELVIPATVEGNVPVTAISAYAFRYNPSLNSVTIPEGITAIGEGAFFGCATLTGVALPQSLQSIGLTAFMGTSMTRTAGTSSRARL